MKIYLEDSMIYPLMKNAEITVVAEHLKQLIRERTTNPREEDIRKKLKLINDNTLGDGTIKLIGKGNNDYEI